MGGVKFLGPVVYNQEGMQWHGHILYITPGGGGGTKSFLKLRRKLLIFPTKLKSVADSSFTAALSAAELNIFVINHATS